MKVLKKDFKKGEIKAEIENLDDLWYLSQIIDIGDLVKGKSFRKIKIGKDENIKVVRKPVFLEIKVEKIEFGKTSSVLRVLGVITQGPENVAKGDHHTFNLESGSVFSVKKEKFLKFQIDRLKEASVSKVPKILIVVHDRESVLFAILKKYGFEVLSELKGDVQKKAVDEKKEKSFYASVIKQIDDYLKRYKIEQVILASPAFFKEDLMKEFKGDKSKIFLSSCSSVSKNAVDEVLKRGEVRNLLKQDRITKEVNFVEELLNEVSKDGKAAYGIKEVENAVNAGAVEKLFVTDKLIMKLRDKGKYEKLDLIMKTADSLKSEIHIISSDHDGGKKLDGLGGVGALLRYKVSY